MKDGFWNYFIPLLIGMLLAVGWMRRRRASEATPVAAPEPVAAEPEVIAAPEPLYVLRLEPLASADQAAVVAAVAPNVQRYLTGPLDALPTP